MHTSCQKKFAHVKFFFSYTSFYLKFKRVFEYLKWYGQGLIKNVYSCKFAIIFQLYYCTIVLIVLLYHYTIVILYYCTNCTIVLIVPLYNCTNCTNCTIVLLYYCTIVPLYYCTNCTIVLLFYCTILLMYCVGTRNMRICTRRTLYNLTQSRPRSSTLYTTEMKTYLSELRQVQGKLSVPRWR